MSNEANQKSSSTDEDDAFYAKLKRDILLLMDDDEEEYHEALFWMANMDRDFHEAKKSGVVSARDSPAVVANNEKANGETEYSRVTRNSNQTFWRPKFDNEYQKTEDSRIAYDENWSLSSQPIGFSYPSQPEGGYLWTYMMPTWFGSNPGGKSNGTGVFIPPDTKSLPQIKPKITDKPKPNLREPREPNSRVPRKSNKPPKKKSSETFTTKQRV